MKLVQIILINSLSPHSDSVFSKDRTVYEVPNSFNSLVEFFGREN